MQTSHVPLLAAAVLFSGCMSATAYQTASVVPQGKFRAFAAGEGFVASGEKEPGDPTNPSSAAAVQVEGGFRYGLGGGWDVGSKLWLFGGQLEVKKELVHGGPHVLSLAATAGGYLGCATSQCNLSFDPIVSLPLFYGYRFGNGDEVVLGPRVTYVLLPFPGAGADTVSSTLYAGASLGLAIKVGKQLRIMPEISFAVPVAASGALPGVPYWPVENARTPIGELRFLQFGIAFIGGE